MIIIDSRIGGFSAHDRRSSAGTAGGPAGAGPFGPLGNYCGKLFADLGADVVLVEPPDGTPLRREPPFTGEGDCSESTHRYMNTNKRSLCLDLDQPGDAATLRELAWRADLVIETQRPGVQDRRGLGWATPSPGHPGLVLVSITPFGQDGPYAELDGDDLIASALGGLLYLGGYADGGPDRPAGEQAVLGPAFSGRGRPCSPYPTRSSPGRASTSTSR